MFGSKKKYLEAPVPTTEMPKGIPYIVLNEAAERFSFYGMRTILLIFMTKYLIGESGVLDPMSDTEAKQVFHYFVASVYFFPFLGALIADRFLGKYRTILYLSIVYCLGHLCLALDETRLGLFLGLGLIAIGSGGIKPCVSANVGDQFGKSNQHLLAKVFSWFYISINLGSFVSTLLTPILLDKYGPSVAFGIPGILMLLATIFFWMGRNVFVHIPAGGSNFMKEAFSKEGLSVIGRLLIVYAFVAVFWSLFDQTGSAWVLQAEQMEKSFMGFEILSSQLQAANPFLILMLVPVFTYWIYPAINKVFPLSPLRKIGIGLFVTAASFGVSALIEHSVAAGDHPHILWQIVPYIILTAGEVMVSITCLEFSYTQSPKTMKSLIMAVFLLSVSAGNLFTSFVNGFIQQEDGSLLLDGPSYYWFFAGVMLVAAVIFVFVAKAYKEKTYMQDEAA